MASAVVFYGPGRPLEFMSVSKPPLREGEILVQVVSCSLCRSDLHSHAGRRSVATPSILGHEIVGRIEAFGPSTSHLDFSGQATTIGDRITWSISIGCGRCFFCQNDIPQKCERLFKYGHEPIAAGRSLGGGLAEFVLLLPRTNWLKLPDVISDAVAALANCAAATAAAVLRYAGPVVQQRVLVEGAGVLGTIACAMARAAGAAQVLVVDPDATCRERATMFGATHVFDAAEENLLQAVMDATDGIGADVVFELAGKTESVEAALALVRTGGTVVLAGTVADGEPISIDPQAIVRRMTTLRGVHNYHPRDLQAAVAFLAERSDQFPFDKLVVETFPLDQAEQALRCAHSMPGQRVAVVPA
jgi:putative phosphonate catabolism associated alcohol dehydrogenase